MANNKLTKPDSRRGRRSYRDIFISEIEKQSGGGEKLVNNKVLRESLKWEQDRFDSIRAQLIEENIIVATRGGPGGATSLKNAKQEKALSLFISYSKADEELKGMLVKHLEPLKRLNLVSEWNFRQIVPGDKWEYEINKQLESASIIIFLVSIDFINSAYCYEIEMETALERYEKGQCVVIPILLRHCMWQHAPFAKIQSLPEGMKAVTAWPDQDQAFVNVAEGIKAAAEGILLKRGVT